MSSRPEGGELNAGQRPRSQRILACKLCSQRKIKCQRSFPCANCIRSGASCVPSTTAPRRRRQLLPDRELQLQLRKYEDLLRQNNIPFDPIERDKATEPQSSETRECIDSDDELHNAGKSSEDADEATPGSERSKYQPRSIWHAVRGKRDNDDESQDDQSDDSGRVVETTARRIWMSKAKTHFLVGQRHTYVDLALLHPNPVHIFRLWQIYLENIDPLLKVTHAPSLQVRIIEAASNVSKIDANMHALLFSIYCVSVFSLSPEDCQTILETPRDELLENYHNACEEALINCEFLATNDRDCLTALLLYLISMMKKGHPSALSSVLGIAARIAQRMGLHNATRTQGCDQFESEMRHRLWWALVLYDNRVGELSNWKSGLLAPTWDCPVPLNLNDADIRPEMQQLPSMLSHTSDTIFAVVRSEIGDFMRHAEFHLDFTTPSLKAVAKDALRPITKISDLEKMLEDRYFRFLNLSNPIHYMTLWTARTQLARCRLFYHYSKNTHEAMVPTEADRDFALYAALQLLDADTKLMASPLTKRYFWLLNMHFPFPAYLHIVQDLKQRPTAKHAAQAWKHLSANYDARVAPFGAENAPLLGPFSRAMFQAWDIFTAAHSKSGRQFEIPSIICDLRQATEHIKASPSTYETPATSVMLIDNKTLEADQNVLSQERLFNLGPDLMTDMLPGQSTPGLDWDQIDWTNIGWPVDLRQGW